MACGNEYVAGTMKENVPSITFYMVSLSPPIIGVSIVKVVQDRRTAEDGRLFGGQSR